MATLPTHADGSCDVLGAWFYMLDQCKEGGAMKMVEGIRNVHRFIHDERFYPHFKKGIDMQFLLPSAPENDEERKMVDEIRETTQLYKRRLLFENNPNQYMEIEAGCAYETSGFNGLVRHFKERFQINGKPMDEQSALGLARSFEADYKNKPIGEKE